MLKILTCLSGRRDLAKIQTSIDKKKIGLAINILSFQVNKKCFSQSITAHQTTKQPGYIRFLDTVKQRKAEARKSLIVQVQSEQSYKELYTYCSYLGTVNKMFHYSVGIEPSHYIIVEFAEELDVSKIFNVSTFNAEVGVPTQSHFMWFRAANRKLAKLKPNKNSKLDTRNSIKHLSENELKTALCNCAEISDQILFLYNSTKLNDVGIRLRFLTGLQIEACISGMFPHAIIFPFGSSVNGFGKNSCDLDLVLKLNSKENSDESRLVFHCKGSSGSERSMNQKYLESIGDLIQLFLPGCTQVRRILQARIPIIKFNQQFTDIECDLSMSNMSGVYMSDFLYMMGEFDERVRPLIFVIRHWAKVVGITNSSPGKWISNFSLSLLVIFFLQKPLNSPPILPSLNTLVKHAGPDDKYVTEDGINCTFLRDLNKLNYQRRNSESLEALLKEFFEYYAQFDFLSKAISLNEAAVVTKPEYNAMYIINPLEKGLNVSKNVSLEEVDKFQREVRNAIWILDSQENKDFWGILNLMFKNKNSGSSNVKLHKRLMNVNRLFEEENKQITEINYENADIKKQVDNIRKFTKEQIQNLKSTVKTNR